MSFERPGFFVLLLIVPLLVGGAILAYRKRGDRWRQLVASRLMPILVRERSNLLRWISFGILLLGFVFLITALTAPNAGYRETPETIRGRNIILAVDVSKSMLATDAAPTRLGAARAAALELLDHFPNDRVGVIAFSGVAWLQAPLTIDHSAVREVFQQLEFQDTANEWIPRSGSDLSVAVELAVKTFRDTGQRDNALIILSDGESHEGDVDDATTHAREAGVTVFTVGFGTDDGSFLPDPDARDGKFHDREGNLVLSRLQTDDLRHLAKRTGGLYTAGSGPAFSATLKRAVERLDQYELEGRNRRIAIPRFQWFLAPAMVLFIVGLLLNANWRIATRPATAVLLAMLALGSLCEAEAGIIPRTKAEQAYSAGDHQRALELFEQEVAAARGERKSRLHLGEAAAAYRLGHFGHASRAYSGALLSRNGAVQEEAHFGLGNTEFYQGLRMLNGEGKEQQPPDPKALEATILYWRDAIAHFEGALAMNAENERARANRDHIQKRLEELLKEQEKQQEEEKKQQQNNDPEQDPKEKNGEEDPENDPKEEGEDPKEPGEDPNDGNNDPKQSPPEGSGNPDEPNDPEQAPPEPGEQPDPNNPEPGENENRPPPEGDPLDQNPGETPEQFARRILSDNADFQEKPLPLRFRNLPRPKKNW